MAKKQRLKQAVNPEKHSAKPQEMAPDYYGNFHCIGPDCEDSCCIGWRVDLDRKTWQRYQEHQSEPLATLVRKHVVVEPDPQRRSDRAYAYIGLSPNGDCSFLQADRLCMIQKELGCEALSETCSAFPRLHNRFAENLEYGLDVSCPEAARLILLPEAPIKLKAIKPESNLSATDLDLRARGFMTHTTSAVDQRHNAFRHSFRELILRILQLREVSLGGRMMLLGLLLDDVTRVIKNPHYKGSADIFPILTAFKAYLDDPSSIDAQFEQIPGNVMRKLQVTTGFLVDFMVFAKPRFGECILACVSGLIGNAGSAEALRSHYFDAYENHYLPYFRDHGHVLENYLVNDVTINLFPFIRGDYLDQYRTLVFNLTIIQMMLVGMAGHHRGLNDGLVVQLIQSYTRMTAHNHNYLDKLRQAFGCGESPAIEEIVWMLKEY